MSNVSPQARMIANEKIRAAADRFGQLYGLAKMLRAEVGQWLSLFPADAEVIADGSVQDGRTILTNADARAFSTLLGDYISSMEQTNQRPLDLAMKLAVNPGWGHWAPPVGIPAPTFGIVEMAPATPESWVTEVPGFYYVDYLTGTDSHTYGTPSAPRKTIPRFAANGSLPAGSVVEVHGPYDFYHGSPFGITCAGTADAPVFIRGVSAATKTQIRRYMEIKGTYFILENLRYLPLDTSNSAPLYFYSPVSHAAIRHCELSGNPTSGTGLAVTNFGGGSCEYVVIWDNYIHDHGDVHAQTDQDYHGIAVTANVDHLWIVDNELARNSGDGVQVNAGSIGQQSTLHHVYIGRNVSHGNKQSGLWVKQAEDVIISQNRCYAHRLGNSSSGQGLGFQYGPERVWFLCNEVYDCEYGIYLGSGSGGYGTVAYIVGNLFHNIHAFSGGFNPNTGFCNAAIMNGGIAKLYVVNNTISDVDAGVVSPSSATHIIANNIIVGITQVLGSHIFLEFSAAATLSSLHHTLLDTPTRIKWGAAATDLPGFQAANPGKGLYCAATDPHFVAPTDFSLQANSPAIDAGAVEDVYTTFYSRYAIDIARDVGGTPRPQQLTWDLGAYERVG